MPTAEETLDRDPRLADLPDTTNHLHAYGMRCAHRLGAVRRRVQCAERARAAAVQVAEMFVKAGRAS